MDLDLDWICERMGARSARRSGRIQSLWSGYGEIVRVGLEGAELPNVIVKAVRASDRPQKETTSDKRKRRSYEVERSFYRTFAAECPSEARVARCFGEKVTADGSLLLLEDLDDAGFSRRVGNMRSRELSTCLEWLAAFHAAFLGKAPEGLFRHGTYWHLSTREEELRDVKEPELALAARRLAGALDAARFTTIVHGDAKPANFCFSRDGSRAAAVDFQYSGGGAGVRDVAYLLSCLDDPSESEMAPFLDDYFTRLKKAVETRAGEATAGAVVAEWRSLFPVAFVDFQRFLAGWRGGMRLEPNARQLVVRVLRETETA